MATGCCSSGCMAWLQPVRTPAKCSLRALWPLAGGTWLVRASPAQLLLRATLGPRVGVVWPQWKVSGLSKGCSNHMAVVLDLNLPNSWSSPCLLMELMWSLGQVTVPPGLGFPLCAMRMLAQMILKMFTAPKPPTLQSPSLQPSILCFFLVWNKPGTPCRGLFHKH